MRDQTKMPTQRLVWLEGVRIFAAVMILLYHAQLMVSQYAYTPQPTGIAANFGLLMAGNQRTGDHPLLSLLNSPLWFGFQFVDVFVLVSGFSLVLSLKGEALQVGPFLEQRFLRILYPLWTITWLSYPVLWAIGMATQSYIPDAWHVFAAATFPLLYDYAGELLLPVSGPWWFVSLILSFTLVFPVLWRLLQRWGDRNLLVVSILLTVLYRAMAVFWFNGHPTYAIVESYASWYPFVPFIAKLSTFVVGMVVAVAYTHRVGPLYWSSRKALAIGIPLYALGFVCQFYAAGWVVADLLVPLGLGLCCMVVFRQWESLLGAKATFLWLGARSYSFFLIHNFVVDRTINLAIHDNHAVYYLLLPVMLVGTLLLSQVVDWFAPLLQRGLQACWRDADAWLTRSRRRSLWQPGKHLAPKDAVSERNASLPGF
jgi:peptidoglycan/LPS O-acetylase OafA/YrhL